MGDHYLTLLSGLLLGYAIIGKGFAYVGFAPLFVGEAALFTGIFLLLRSGTLIAVLTTLPSLFLATAMVWVLLRTLPFVGEYGFDALRDSVVMTYGAFAFIVIALLLDNARRIETILRYYRVFLNVFIPASPFTIVLYRYMIDYIPKWPGYNFTVLQIGPGEAGTHVAGAAVFCLIGFGKLAPLNRALMFIAVVSVSAASRSGMMAIFLTSTFAALMLGRVRELAAVLVMALVIFSTAYAVESTYTGYQEPNSSEERSLSTRQIADNVASIIGRSGEQTEGTKTWRLEWWDIIVDETLYGPYFWTGRGFGLNLADAHGFRTDFGGAPLRSPHNVNMTILARAGVPGLALWLGFLASWFGMLMRAMLSARRREQTAWAGLFLFVTCYVMAIIINATFDVALEGPTQGIWFWCLIGLGIGSVMVYRAQMLGALPVRPLTTGPAGLTSTAEGRRERD